VGRARAKPTFVINFKGLVGWASHNDVARATTRDCPYPPYKKTYFCL